MRRRATQGGGIFDSSAFFSGLAAILGLAVGTWAVSIVKRDVSIADCVWGLFFLLAAATYAVTAGAIRQRTVFKTRAARARRAAANTDMKRPPASDPVSVHDVLPLRRVAGVTALTPDLIRAWEKRYAVVAPIRGARGARLYTLRDIAHLRQLARVVASGRAIGDVAALPPTMLQRLATRGGPDPVVAETRAAPARARFRTQVLEHLQSFDQAAIARLLGDAVVALGARAFVREIAEPLVHDVGARWAEGELSIAQEHLLIAALRNLLAALLREQTPAGRPMVLATPAGERHEVGLLLVALLAADAGVNVINLGVDLPAADIAAVAARVRARVVGLSVVGKANRRRAAGEVAAIQLALSPSSELWLGGTDAGGVAARVAHFRGLTVTSAAMTETELSRIGAVDRA